MGIRHMHQSDIAFLEDSFKRYYFEHTDLLRVPDRAHLREFGYQRFGSGMIRHLRVRDDRQLHLLFMQNVPSDAYCSNACYSFPDLPMNDKDWKEADLIFDIDAKDLNLPCRADHVVCVCSKCRHVWREAGACPACGCTNTAKVSLPCRRCMEASKAEVSKLADILADDLAVDPGQISTCFSGNEGFHVYVHDSQFGPLESRARADLADYIMFRGAIPETFGMKRHNPAKAGRSAFPEIGERGWRGRFSREVFGSKSRRPQAITQLIKGGYPAFQDRLDGLCSSIGVRIDPNVTMDVHRIFRLPGSINSKSGMVKLRCADLKGFDPYVEAALLGDDPVEVTTSGCPVRFRLRRRQFGPYEAGRRITVPRFAAAYLVCKGLASTVAAESDAGGGAGGPSATTAAAAPAGTTAASAAAAIKTTTP